jgi:type I restriction enzyme R subunit
VKTFGNIICFRNLQKETDEAISLFGDKDAGGTILLKSYDYYYDQYKGYIKHLLEEFSLDERISGEEAEKEFIKLFSGILRLRNILLAFDDFEDDELLNDREFQDYQSRYLDIYQKYKEKDKSEKTDVTQDVKFEIELVRQVEINIDYILRLIESYCKSNRKDKEVMVQLRSAIGSSIQLRSKRELIEKFIEKVGIDTNIDDEWGTFVTEQWRIDLDTIIEEEELKPEETEIFVRKSFKDDEVSTIGTGLDDLLPPMSLFDDSRADKKQRIIDRLQSFFEKYQGLA